MLKSNSKLFLCFFLVLTLISSSVPLFAASDDSQNSVEVSTPVAKDAVYNGSFEEGMTRWESWSNFAIVEDTKNVHSGKKALGIAASGGGMQALDNLEPLTTYKFSAWGRYDKEAGEPMNISFWYLSEGNNNWFDLKFDAKDTEWTYKELIFTTPAQTETAWIQMWKNEQNAAFYLDDVSIVPVHKPNQVKLAVDNQLKDTFEGSVSAVGNVFYAPLVTVVQKYGAVLNAKVTFNEAQQVLVVDRADKTFVVDIKNRTINNNQVSRKANKELMQINGLTYGSLSLLDEIFGVKAGWNPLRNTIRIKTSEPVLNHGDNSPVLESIYPVAPDILAVKIKQGNLVMNKIVPYEEKPGDKVNIVRDGHNYVDIERHVIRDGKDIGYLIGPDKKFINLHEDMTGDMLKTFDAETATNYVFTSQDGSSNYVPVDVYIKHKPFASTIPVRKMAVEYTYYLKFDSPLQVGKTYNLNLKNINLNKESTQYTHDPSKSLSEAIHINQIGFRPDDTVKRAFLSLWMGSEGGLKYNEGLDFYVINNKTNKVVYKGKTELAVAADKGETLRGNKNNNLTDVYKMDFEKLKAPGTYRIYVEGVGCSYTFDISKNAWKNAFSVAMKGFYHMRSGIELGAPYTGYERPRDHHPEDGFKIYQSTCSLLNSGNGLNALGTDSDNFANLVNGKTDILVPEAWGGYHDAGDWDKRIQHLISTRQQLELYLQYPEYFKGVSWNIPDQTDKELPDLLDEALFSLDLYYRLQMPDGGIRGGVEFDSHPTEGETSWMDSQNGYVYAPDHWSSYIYVSTALRMSTALERFDKELAKKYSESAVKAMEWAEAEYSKWLKDSNYEKFGGDSKFKSRDERNLAALEMYKMTKDKKWHDIFLETTIFEDAQISSVKWGVHDQREAVIAYAMLSSSMADSQIQKNCKDIIIREADEELSYIDGNAFNLGYSLDAMQPMLVGYYSSPQGEYLAHAYTLTKKEKYLNGLIKVSQFSAGANPMNISFTVGVGHNNSTQLFHMDSRRSGQKTPIGLTPYGMQTFEYPYWVWSYVTPGYVTPIVHDWPQNEVWIDIYQSPMTHEWTPDVVGRCSYIWGLLAARK